MSIRSYKDIYNTFERLFPELAKSCHEWKGVKFVNKHILIIMKDGSHIHFWYRNSKDWELICYPSVGADRDVT